MKFVLTDFFHDGGYRVFAFETLPRSEAGRYWVKADMNLARRHGISLQELPLLCRAALEAGVDTHPEHTITYTANEMMQIAKARAATVSTRRRKPYPPRPRA